MRLLKRAGVMADRDEFFPVFRTVTAPHHVGDSDHKGLNKGLWNPIMGSTTQPQPC
jgi:hypothetical protein